MKILVVGNGFDLAHDLPTSYSNFLDFLRACLEYKTNSVCSFQYYDFCVRNRNKQWFDEIVEYINSYNKLLHYFWEIYGKRCSAGKSGWIDFENELSTIIKALDEERKFLIEQDKGNLHKVSSHDRKIVDRLLMVNFTEYPDGFKDGRIDGLLDDLNKLTRLLEIYLVEFVGTHKIKKSLSIIQALEITHVISFNYTDTYQKLYDPFNKLAYCYIHGKAQKDNNLEECNLVLGIDEYLDILRRDTDNSFVWFKKFYQRIFKGTGSEYIDWINLANTDAIRFPNYSPNEVYIYGHSLDITDKDILSRLILMNNTKTIIYYYSKDDLAKKIENLVKVIGEDELISRTGGQNKTISFKKC